MWNLPTLLGLLTHIQGMLIQTSHKPSVKNLKKIVFANQELKSQLQEMEGML